MIFLFFKSAGVFISGLVKRARAFCLKYEAIKTTGFLFNFSKIKADDDIPKVAFQLNTSSVIFIPSLNSLTSTSSPISL